MQAARKDHIITIWTTRAILRYRIGYLLRIICMFRRRLRTRIHHRSKIYSINRVYQDIVQRGRFSLLREPSIEFPPKLLEVLLRSKLFVKVEVYLLAANKCWVRIIKMNLLMCWGTHLEVHQPWEVPDHTTDFPKSASSNRDSKQAQLPEQINGPCQPKRARLMTSRWLICQ